MNKIIFINRFYYPDQSATSQLLTSLSAGLAETGESICIVTGRRLYQQGETILPSRGTYQGVDIRRIRTTDFNRFGLPGRALDFATFYLLATVTLLIHVRAGDILVAKTDPPLMSVLVRLVGTLRRVKTINWLQDIFPEVAEQLGMVPRGYGVGHLLRGLRNWSLRYADANVVLGERMREKLLTLGVPENRIHVIPNWSDETAITPLPHPANSLRKAWGLSDKFVVIYSGNMGRAHNFDTIIEAAKQLKNYPHIVFLWVGGGVKKEALQSAARKEGLTNFQFKDSQPKSRLRETLAVGDAHLVTLAANLEGLIVPSKFYGAIAAGRPVVFVGDKQGEVAQIIAKTGCGYAFQENEAKKLADSLVELSCSPKILQEKGEKARLFFEQECGQERAFGRWARVLENVRKSGRRSIFTGRLRSGPSKSI